MSLNFEIHVHEHVLKFKLGKNISYGLYSLVPMSYIAFQINAILMNFLLFENKKRIQFGTRTRLEKLENIIKNLSPPSSINLLGKQVLNAIINQNDF